MEGVRGGAAVGTLMDVTTYTCGWMPCDEEDDCGWLKESKEEKLNHVSAIRKGYPSFCLP